jgi:peptidoglycan/LPS O-acetylase OafA/YrhL
MRRIVRLGVAWMTAHLEEPRTGQSLPALDGVRACACLAVVAFHINLISHIDLHLWNVSWNPIIGSVLLAGDAGVVLFFVLSGFLLFMPYARALLMEAPWPDTRVFYLKRMLRIMPAYYLSLFLLVMFAAPQYLHPDRWGQLFLFGILYNDTLASTFQKINGPYWTLAIEWQFYLLLPWLMLGIRALVRRWAPLYRGRAVAWSNHQGEMRQPESSLVSVSAPV